MIVTTNTVLWYHGQIAKEIKHMIVDRWLSIFFLLSGLKLKSTIGTKRQQENEIRTKTENGRKRLCVCERQNNEEKSRIDDSKQVAVSTDDFTVIKEIAWRSHIRSTKNRNVYIALT